MKNIFIAMKLITVCSLFILCLNTGCKKEDKNTSGLPAAPEAKAEHDNKSGGIYKGVLIGSSGTIKVVLQDGRYEVIVTIDGVTKTLTTTGLGSWTSGQAITDVEFKNGDWKVRFSVKGDGSDPEIEPGIAGHLNMVVAIVKESSTQLIKVYEGTYTGPGAVAPYNNWNFISNGTTAYGIYNDDTGEVEEITGSISGSTITGTTTGGAHFTGTFSGDNVLGGWTNGSDKGNWLGSRKM